MDPNASHSGPSTLALALMYCPNCYSNVNANATHCPECKANFEEISAWKPLPQAPVKQPKQEPIFSREPKLIHATHAIVVFLVAGPPFGLLLINIITGFRFSTDLLSHITTLIFSYFFGLMPAAFAGILYSILASSLVSIFPSIRIHGALGSLLGGLAGAISGSLVLCLIFMGAKDFSTKVVEIGSLCLFAGLGAGFTCGWLLPVGKQGNFSNKTTPAG